MPVLHVYVVIKSIYKYKDDEYWNLKKKKIFWVVQD